MARDKGLKEMVNDALAGVPGLTQKAMFGGWAWFVNGICCAAPVMTARWCGSARIMTPGR